MSASSLHLLPFALLNSHSFSLDPDGPFPVLYRLLTTSSPSIRTLDLTHYAGRTILITGGTSGCGLECARALALVGCHLLVTSRSRERGEQVVLQIREEAKAANAETLIQVVALDMMSFESVKSLPSRLDKLVSKLDLCILNAGVYQAAYSLGAGNAWEETVQVNVLANSALTLLLHPYLSRSDHASLLIVSSEAHAWADPQQNTIEELLHHMNKPDGAGYPSYQRYHISKLILLLWVKEISRRQEWKSIAVAAVSPGLSRTQLFRDFNGSFLARILEAIVCRSSGQGAAQYIYALNDMIHGRMSGGFWSDGNWRRPSRAMLSENGQGLQATVYEGLGKILRAEGIVEEAQK